LDGLVGDVASNNKHCAQKHNDHAKGIARLGRHVFGKAEELIVHFALSFDNLKLHSAARMFDMRI
jgi:hypothetical protein